ncbi:MAG TPA: DUF692 domain-containing protein [Kiloniellales bacterium]|nr:DUF692 domain-containing protein [Kiloniellales bacterium]
MPAARAGVGLRHPHVLHFLQERPRTAFLEVHSENYMSDGGPRRRALFDLAEHYPISLHGVGLSLGSAEGLDAAHLGRLKGLLADYRPALVSEHLSWSVESGAYLNDLLPLPYTEEALAVVCRNVDAAQEALGRPLLVENPSSYLTYAASSLSEPEFLGELVRRTGCGLLLDVNNVYVSARNQGFDAAAYLAALPTGAVGEIHLAGHTRRRFGAEELLIDDHGSRVAEAVWALYRQAVALCGPRPTLIEWDSAIPEASVLLAEARKADVILAAADPTVQGHVA